MSATLPSSLDDRAERVTRHDGPDYLVISEHPLLRRFWYAACFSADVTTEPVARTVLGTKLVLWRAARDR
ncbi:MAG TPA: hypothetical protein VGG83_28915, partial [Trebonia sp.]